MAYSEKVMDHFQHPRNVGKMDDADGVGEVGNAKCGDIMKIYIKVKDDIITDIKFNTFGCGSAIAASSMATEMIKGKPISQALELTNKAVVEALDGLPPAKIHCSVLAEEAVKAAIDDYYKKKAAKKSSSNKSGSGSGSSKTNGSTVYWTPGGAVYHRTPNCPTLSRSRTIYHGSISSCPKNRGCKVCF